MPRAYGYKHLYLYSLDGTLIRQLTSGEWPVSKVSKVDEEGDWVYFEGWTETPLERHLYRGLLSESADSSSAGGPGEVEQVKVGAGWHAGVLGPKAAHLIDTHSTLMQPPQVHLQTVRGERLTTLEPNDLPERDEVLWLPPKSHTGRDARRVPTGAET